MKIQYAQTYPGLATDTSQGNNGNGTNRNKKGPGEVLWLVQKPTHQSKVSSSFEELLQTELKATRIEPQKVKRYGEYVSGQKPLNDEIEQRAMAHLHEFWA